MQLELPIDTTKGYTLIEEAIELAKPIIQKYEGCRLEAYPDPISGGPPFTIGWGSTVYVSGEHVKPGDKITQKIADETLDRDMRRRAECILEWVEVDLTPGQLAALISFAWNLGLGALHHSTLLRHLNVGAYGRAASEFVKWCHAGGRVLPNLVERRMDERDLFAGIEA